MRRHLPPGGRAAAEDAARGRRRSTARVATTTAANATSWTATARDQPSRAASDTSPSDGVAAQKSACHVASTDPPTKPASVSTIGVVPAPRWKSVPDPQPPPRDRKSTRLNSSHSQISYAVFCLKKKTNNQNASID